MYETILTWDGGLQELTAIKDHWKKRELDQALIPPGDGERLKAVLPQTEID